MDSRSDTEPAVPRADMRVDVVCAGFGPATGGFLTTLSRAVMRDDGTPRLESRAMPGMPLQVLCFERADDLAAGVSGVVSRARGIRASFPDLASAGVPLMHPVTSEEVVYLLDPIGASKRSRPLRFVDALLARAGGVLGIAHHGILLPWIPPFMHKHDGIVFSLGQFNQWVAGQVMGTGAAQIWPTSPVAAPLFDESGARVTGVRLVDQGTDLSGAPSAGYTPGMDVFADLTVVGDGPVGAVGRALDERLGLPDGHVRDEWALGMKMVVDLRDDVDLAPGTVIHTMGYPEPEIFGFLYVLAPKTVTLGIFVPSWFRSPLRTAYRYLQHWMLHPWLWRWLEGGTLRSWGAKSVQESGRRGEPHLVGDGFARIGEGSGSTNPLTASGVDEAWTTGTLLAEAVIEILERGEPFTKDALHRAYVARRRASWLERELQIAEGARDGFTRGVISGLVGMGLSGLTNGFVRPQRAAEHPHPRLDAASTLDEDMTKRGWPAIPFDGKLLITHQDALLVGGKVQAPPGYADHVRFTNPQLCRECTTHLCASMCSGQAITDAPEGGGVVLDREKCVHCGACLWNCPDGNVQFLAGAGGLHSVEN